MFYSAVVSMKLHPGYHKKEGADPGPFSHCAAIADAMLTEYKRRF